MVIRSQCSGIRKNMYIRRYGEVGGERGVKMAIKGTKTIAEYAIRKWLEKEGFVIECFKIEMKGNEALITDGNGDELRLIYDRNIRRVVCPET